MFISVIICTHNPRVDYLRRTLNSLSEQNYQNTLWDLLIVDSGCNTPLDEGFLQAQHPRLRIKVMREALAGLTRARVCGIQHTKGDLILFVDDDNVLSSNYISILAQYGLSHQDIGVFGPGKVLPEFEQQPNSSILPLLPSLVLRDISTSIRSNIFNDSATPYGAGMAVRRSVAEKFSEFINKNTTYLQLGRTGTGLMGGEDLLFSYICVQLGLLKGLFTDMNLVHLIPAFRVQTKYLLRLAYANGSSEALLETVTGHQIGCPNLGWRILDYLQKIRRGDWTVARARMLQFKGYRDKRSELLK